MQLIRTALCLSAAAAVLSCSAPAVSSRQEIEPHLVSVKVFTDHAGSSYVIKGPGSGVHQGQGRSTSLGVPYGEYTVSFRPIEGFETPEPMTRGPDEEGKVIFRARYRTIPEVRAVRPPQVKSIRFFPGMVSPTQYPVGGYLETGLLHMKWEDVAGADSYRIYKSPGWQDHDTHFDMYNDWSPEMGGRYYLQTIMGRLHGPVSEEIVPDYEAGSPGEEPTPPPPPRLHRPRLIKEGRDAIAELSWDHSPDAASYDVFRGRTDPEDLSIIRRNVIPSPGSKTVGITDNKGLGKRGAMEAVDFFYAVRAVDRQSRPGPPSDLVALRFPESEVRYVKIKYEARFRPARELMEYEPGDPGTVPWPGRYSAVDNRAGRVYISDGKGKKVSVFSAETGRFVQRLGGADGSPARVVDPQGLDVDDKGLVYVVDGQRQAIVLFDSEGEYVREIVLDPEWGGTAEASYVDVAVDRKSGDLYVCGFRTSRILVLGSGGELLRTIDESGWTPVIRNSGDEPATRNIFLDHWGNLGTFVSGPGHRAGFFFYARGGEKLFYWGHSLPYGLGPSLPLRGMTVDAEGNLVVLDVEGQVMAFLPDGRYLYHVAHKKGYPGQIACDASNRLYYTMGGNRLLAVQLSDEIPMVQEENPYASDAGLERRYRGLAH